MNTGTHLKNLMLRPLSAAADSRSLNRRDALGALGLVWAMVLTRAGQSGSHPLPDASIAVFFLLGLFNRSALWLPIALVLAAVVDAWVVSCAVPSGRRSTSLTGIDIATFRLTRWPSAPVNVTAPFRPGTASGSVAAGPPGTAPAAASAGTS